MKTRIFNSQQWFTAVSDWIEPLNEQDFYRELPQSCALNNNLPTLYKPSLENHPFMIWRPSEEISKIRPWHHYPNIVENLKCFNFREIDSNFNTYVVLPLQENRFGIIRNSTWQSRLLEADELIKIQNPHKIGCRWAIYKTPCAWMKHIPKSELWTDQPCLLVKESIWQNL